MEILIEEGKRYWLTYKVAGRGGSCPVHSVADLVSALVDVTEWESTEKHGTLCKGKALKFTLKEQS